MQTPLRLLKILCPLLLTALVACSGGKSSVAADSSLDSTDGAKLSTEQAIAIMRRVESEPLSAEAPELRRRAFEWIVSAKQAGQITLETKYLSELEDSWYPFKGEMMMQFAFGSALWKLTGDSLREDRLAQIEGGLRSMLAAYKNMLLADGKLREPFLDRLDAIRRQGKLREYIEQKERDPSHP